MDAGKPEDPTVIAQTGEVRGWPRKGALELERSERVLQINRTNNEQELEAD